MADSEQEILAPDSDFQPQSRAVEGYHEAWGIPTVPVPDIIATSGNPTILNEKELETMPEFTGDPLTDYNTARKMNAEDIYDLRGTEWFGERYEGHLELLSCININDRDVWHPETILIFEPHRRGAFLSVEHNNQFLIFPSFSWDLETAKSFVGPVFVYPETDEGEFTLQKAAVAYKEGDQFKMDHKSSGQIVSSEELPEAQENPELGMQEQEQEEIVEAEQQPAAPSVEVSTSDQLPGDEPEEDPPAVDPETIAEAPQKGVTVEASGDSGSDEEEPEDTAANNPVEEWLKTLSKSHLDDRLAGKNPMPHVIVFSTNANDAEAAQHLIETHDFAKPHGVTDEDFAAFQAAHSYHDETRNVVYFAEQNIDDSRWDFLTSQGFKGDDDATISYRKFAVHHALSHVGHAMQITNKLAGTIEQVDVEPASKRAIVKLMDDSVMTFEDSKFTASDSNDLQLEWLVAKAKASYQQDPEKWKTFKITGETDDHLIKTVEAFGAAGLKVDKPTQDAYAKAKSARGPDAKAAQAKQAAAHIPNQG